MCGLVDIAVRQFQANFVTEEIGEKAKFLNLHGTAVALHRIDDFPFALFRAGSSFKQLVNRPELIEVSMNLGPRPFIYGSRQPLLAELILLAPLLYREPHVPIFLDQTRSQKMHYSIARQLIAQLEG